MKSSQLAMLFSVYSLLLVCYIVQYTVAVNRCRLAFSLTVCFTLLLLIWLWAR